MSRYNCSVCGNPLGHIDEACPRCLPNFYSLRPKVKVKDKDDEIVRIKEEVQTFEKQKAALISEVAKETARLREELAHYEAEAFNANDAYKNSIEREKELRARVESLEKENKILSLKTEPVRIGFIHDNVNGITDIFVVDEDGDEVDQSVKAESLMEYINTLKDRFDFLKAEVGRLEKENKILSLKCKGTLANNLCPDHRDKQAGKQCLACTVESLSTTIEKVRSWLQDKIDYSASHDHIHMRMQELKAILPPKEAK